MRIADRFLDEGDEEDESGNAEYAYCILRL
jgi:hypothetical protein